MRSSTKSATLVVALFAAAAASAASASTVAMVDKELQIDPGAGNSATVLADFHVRGILSVGGDKPGNDVGKMLAQCATDNELLLERVVELEKAAKVAKEDAAKVLELVTAHLKTTTTTTVTTTTTTATTTTTTTTATTTTATTTTVTTTTPPQALHFTLLGAQFIYTNGVYQIAAEFGQPAEDRVIISVLGMGGNKKVVASVGGVTTSQIHGDISGAKKNKPLTYMHRANVPSGTTGLIKYTYTGIEEAGIIWGSINTADATPAFTASSHPEYHEPTIFTDISVDKGGVLLLSITDSGDDNFNDGYENVDPRKISWNGAGTPKQSVNAVDDKFYQIFIYIDVPSAVSGATLSVATRGFGNAILAIWNP